MPKITDEPLEVIQVRLFKRDLNKLRSMYKGDIGVNRAIRTMVRSIVKQIDAKADAAIDDLEAEVPLEQLLAAGDE